MNRQMIKGSSLGAKITRASSKQTYYTIRLFADRQRREDAYRAYGYFRWVDDVLDAAEGTPAEKAAFVDRQRTLLGACYRGEEPQGLCAEERMLVQLVRHDDGSHPGLHAYLDHMMAVMEFDAGRRGRLVSMAELENYTNQLAVAVMNALLYFIGHDNPGPENLARYHAITAAHIVHMLRDTGEDIEAGYFNVPQEFLLQQGISPYSTDSGAYRLWVWDRVQLARQYFESGRDYIARVPNFRCRLAGFAYTARFKWVLRFIERDRCRLRAGYPQRKGLKAGLWMLASMCLSMLGAVFSNRRFSYGASQAIGVEK